MLRKSGILSLNKLLRVSQALEVKDAMQSDFDDWILASPIIQIFLRQPYFLLFSSKECQNFT